MARCSTPTYTVQARLVTTRSDEAVLERRFDAAARLQNAVTDHALKALKELFRNRRHKKSRKGLAEAQRALRPIEERISELERARAAALKKEGPERTEEERALLRRSLAELRTLRGQAGPLRERKAALTADLADLRHRFGLTEHALQAYAAEGARRQGLRALLSANEVQKIGTRVWFGVRKCLFGDGRRLRFVRRGDLASVEGKSNKQGVRLLVGEGGGWEMVWATQTERPDGSRKRTVLRCPLAVRPRDGYLREALASSRVKYCRVVRRFTAGRAAYYLQAALEGTPPDKGRAVSDLRGGVDRGPSSVAVVNELGECLLAELGAECKGLVAASEGRQESILKRMDASRRATNPGNFNSDGTCKRGPKRWVRSKAYERLLAQLRDERAKCKAWRKQECEVLANRILGMCGEVVWEPMDFRALAKRSRKPAETDPATGRRGRKRRFGKSIQSHAPAQLSACVERKLAYRGKRVREVDLWEYRASQLDHLSGEVRKPGLSERWKELSDGSQVQRDLYSAFLLLCARPDLKAPDPELCEGLFPAFLEGHDLCVADMRARGLTMPSVFGF